MVGKILVTGATGNIGGEIVRLLKEKNADFVAATNSRSIDEVWQVAMYVISHLCIYRFIWSFLQ